MLRISFYGLGSTLLVFLISLQPYYASSGLVDEEDVIIDETATGESLDGIDEIVKDVGNVADEYIIYLIIAVNIAVAGFIVKCLIWFIKYINNSGSSLMNWPFKKQSTATASVNATDGHIQLEEARQTDGGTQSGASAPPEH